MQPRPPTARPFPSPPPLPPFCWNSASDHRDSTGCRPVLEDSSVGRDRNRERRVRENAHERNAPAGIAPDARPAAVDAAWIHPELAHAARPEPAEHVDRRARQIRSALDALDARMVSLE